MKTAVVILNWNGKDYLEKFLPSVVEFSAGSAEVIVADNASTDDSINFLQERYPQIRIIENPENGGFSKGYNDALKEVDAEYYVLLNSDVEVTENWIDPIINMMDADPSIAACQPKIHSLEIRSQFEYAGGAGGFIDAYGYPFCRGRIFDQSEEDTGQYDDSCEVFWATGACMFVRAKLYHQSGGLDEDFFAHMEEIDFCWRIKNQGYKIMFCAESTVYHLGGGSLPQISPRKTFLNFRNNLSLLVKNLPSNRLVWVLVVRYVLDMFAALNFLRQGRRADAGAICSAHAHLLQAFPGLMRKRKSLTQAKVSQVYRGCIVYDYFVRGVTVFTGLKKHKWQ